jgi:hypothetical protein
VKYLPFGEELMQNLFFLSTALHQKVKMEGFGEIEEHCGR